MNTVFFNRAFLKIAGLTILLWGVVTLTSNIISSIISWFTIQGMEQFLSKRSTFSSFPTSTHLDVSRGLFITTLMKLAGSIVQVFIGLYLCRRYQTIMNWLFRDADPNETLVDEPSQIKSLYERGSC